MSIGAANALLKNLEEPLPGRIIIATTTNKQAILDTILSRAFVVHFQEMRLSEIEGYLAEHYQHLDAHMRKFAASYSI